MRSGDVVSDRFELEALAAAGGMGAIFRARDRLDGATVALKVIIGDSGDGARRFAREAEVLRELRHPGIVRYIAHGVTGSGAPYLAMEWVDGEDLETRLARAPLTPAESIDLVRRAAEALGAAHARGVVHRDVKPSNLLLCDGSIERVKVADFGIARATSHLTMVTKSGFALGTPAYMAPEQARGEREVDARADVFSLGCVLFQCLVGRPPFVAAHALAVLAKILLEEAPSLASLQPDLPRAVDALLARMLAKFPDKRPRDGAALALELTRLGDLGDLPTALLEAPPASLTTSEQRFVCTILVHGVDTTDRIDASALIGDGDRTLKVRELVPRVGNTPAGNATVVDLRGAAHRHGGQLELVADGAAVAVIEGRGEATDQAARAARCALSLRASATDALIVVATGRAVVADGWPIGQAIDRAAGLLHDRMGMSGDRPLPIALDEVTAGLLDARFDVRTVGDGFALYGERPSADVTRTLLGKETPFVGRDAELRLLDLLFDECCSGPDARAVLVTAPAGVGKSRLRHELVRKLRGRAEVWMGRGDPMSAGSPFGMIGPAIRRTAGILDGESLDGRRRKLRARVSRHVRSEDVPRTVEFLGELVGVPFPDEGRVELAAARADPVLMGDQMRRAWTSFVKAEVGAHPLVLVLEDLHWGDLPSVTFVDSLLRELRESPLLVLAVGRPDVHDVFPRLWTGRGLQEIQLRELKSRHAEELVRAVAAGKLPDEGIARIVDRAGGNAFFLEELIRAAVERGADVLPETVMAVVEGRLRALDDDARRILRAASVFGQVFWPGAVATLLGHPESSDDVRAWLAILTERELVTPRPEGRFPNEEEYAFRHAHVREAAYATLTEGDRALGHRLAGAWLESLLHVDDGSVAREHDRGPRAGSDALDAVVLAEHYERGQAPEDAIRYYRVAAEEALEANDFIATIELAERAIRIGGEQNAPGELKLLQAEAHKWLGDAHAVEACAEAALRSLRHGSDGWYAAAGLLSGARVKRGKPEAILDLSRELLELARSGITSPRGIRESAAAAAQILYLGRTAEALALLEAIEPLAAPIIKGNPAVRARVEQARSVVALGAGDIGAHVDHARAAVESLLEAGDVRTACNAETHVGYALIELGANAEAVGALRATLLSAERLGLANVQALARHNLGLALARKGELAAARAEEMSAIEGFRAQGNARLEGASYIYLSIIVLADGDAPEAERIARLAADCTVLTPGMRACAIAALSDALLTQGRIAEALTSAEAAMRSLAESAGHCEDEGFVRLVHATAQHAAGNASEARAAITEARERLLQRVGSIGNELWRDSFIDGVPAHARTMELFVAWSIAAGAPMTDRRTLDRHGRSR